METCIEAQRRQLEGGHTVGIRRAFFCTKLPKLEAATVQAVCFVLSMVGTIRGALKPKSAGAHKTRRFAAVFAYELCGKCSRPIFWKIPYWHGAETPHGYHLCCLALWAHSCSSSRLILCVLSLSDIVLMRVPFSQFDSLRNYVMCPPFE